MVPNHGGRAEAQRSASLLQAPAEIHIISGDAKLRIEPAGFFERRPSEGHVAAGNVLGHLVGKQNMYRSARSVRHTIGDSTIARRGDVWSADSHMSRAKKRVSEVSQPVRIRVRIIIQISDNLTGRRLHADIPGSAQALIRS